MEELKVKAIVLKSLDYKEKDKLLELFSLESGKITTSLKGVRSAKAKLKFAGEMLNLVEYNLVNRNNKYTVVGASLITSFFPIASNFNSYTIACVILEILNKVLNEKEEAQDIFLLTLKTFNKLSEGKICPFTILLKFYLELLKILGFAIEFQKCSNCSKSLSQNVYFSLDSGSFVCESCKNFYDIPINSEEFSILSEINGRSIEELEGYTLSKVMFLLNILNKDLEMRSFIKIKSFTQIQEVVA